MEVMTKTKICSKCGIEYPSTSEYFCKNKECKDGIAGVCKICHNKNSKKCQDKRKAKDPSVLEYFREYAKKKRIEDPKYVEYHKNYDKQRSSKQSVKDLQNKRRKDKYNSSEEERIKILSWNRKYRSSEGGKATRKALHHVREARKRNLPKDFSRKDWEFACTYFNDCCAVCGRHKSECKLAADHWIPLYLGGGTTEDNIVPLCHGINGCNNRKGRRKPDLWLKSVFPEEQTNLILKRIGDYFAQISDEEK